MKIIKPVVTEKSSLNFQTNHHSKRFSEKSDYEEFDAGITSFSTESYSTSVEFSIETFVEKTKLVVTATYDFEYGEKIIFKALFWTFWLPEFWI